MRLDGPFFGTRRAWLLGCTSRQEDACTTSLLCFFFCRWVVIVVVESSDYGIAQWRTLARFKLLGDRMSSIQKFHHKMCNSDSGANHSKRHFFTKNKKISVHVPVTTKCPDFFPNTSYTTKRLTRTSNPSVPQSFPMKQNDSSSSKNAVNGLAKQLHARVLMWVLAMSSICWCLP